MSRSRWWVSPSCSPHCWNHRSRPECKPKQPARVPTTGTGIPCTICGQAKLGGQPEHGRARRTGRHRTGMGIFVSPAARLRVPVIERDLCDWKLSPAAYATTDVPTMCRGLIDWSTWSNPSIPRISVYPAGSAPPVLPGGQTGGTSLPFSFRACCADFRTQWTALALLLSQLEPFEESAQEDPADLASMIDRIIGIAIIVLLWPPVMPEITWKWYLDVARTRQQSYRSSSRVQSLLAIINADDFRRDGREEMTSIRAAKRFNNPPLLHWDKGWRRNLFLMSSKLWKHRTY